MSAPPRTMQHVLNELCATGTACLYDDQADRSELPALRRFAAARGVRFTSTKGYTAHDTPMRTLHLTEVPRPGCASCGHDHRDGRDSVCRTPVPSGEHWVQCGCENS